MISSQLNPKSPQMWASGLIDYSTVNKITILIKINFNKNKF